jgi:hypothetical protein
MSFTDTEKHWLWGCAAATAASRSDVNVAMPHLRGKWSPTNAILRILEPSSMRQSLHSSCPALLCPRVCPPTAHVPSQREVGRSVLRECRFHPSGGSFQAMRVYRSDAGWQERGKDIRADAVIVSMSTPSYPSAWLHPCRARCRFTWQNHCTSHRDWRSDS